MAKGNFRSDRFTCLYCGKRETTVARGRKNNPMFLCLLCADKFDEALKERNAPRIEGAAMKTGILLVLGAIAIDKIIMWLLV